mgnify:CR=1 FL=1
MTNLPELTELCRLIGCSGLDPDMCKNNPQKCSIIRKLTVKEGKEEYIREMLNEWYR